MDIRTLTERDVPALLPLVRGFYSLHRELFGGADPLTDDKAREIVEEMVLDPRSQIIVADAFFISIVPHNRSMLAFAHKRGYDTLNTIELRKELAGEQPHRGRTDLFGIEFKIL
ncbi:MAG: hypothetical protein JXA93_24320 [Anaerolineae bacterium]|nr:hypothetical protein [Anaerolineae bacterium]